MYVGLRLTVWGVNDQMNKMEWSHDGLVVHQRVPYVLHRGKRLYHPTEPRAHQARFEFEGTMYLQQFLSPHTWSRYSYTKEDVLHMFEGKHKCKLDPIYLIQMVLIVLFASTEAEALAAGVKATPMSPFCFVLGNNSSRKPLWDALWRLFPNCVRSSGPSALCHIRDDHKPLLPLVPVTSADWLAARKLVPERPPSLTWTVHYDTVAIVQDITYIPYECDHVHQLIEMVRVVPQTLYESLPVRPKLCMVTVPLTVTVGSQREVYVMVEEACFWQITRQKGVSVIWKRPEPQNEKPATRKRRRLR